MTTNISAENLAALNAARRSDGKFGTRPHAESDVTLATRDTTPIAQMADDTFELEHEHPSLNNVYVTDCEAGKVNLVTEHFRGFEDCAPEGEDEYEYMAERAEVVHDFLQLRHPKINIISESSGEFHFSFRATAPGDLGVDDALDHLAQDSGIEAFHQDFSDEGGPGPDALRQHLLDYDKAVAAGIPEEVASRGYTKHLESTTDLEDFTGYAASDGRMLITKGDESVQLEPNEHGWVHEDLHESLLTHWTDERILMAGDLSEDEQIVDMYGEEALDDEGSVNRLRADEQRVQVNDQRLHTFLGKQRYDELRGAIDSTYDPSNWTSTQESA